MSQSKFDNGWQYRDCCGGNPGCANNRTKNFIDEVFALVHTDINKARDMLYSYMESVETDRDWHQMKRKELHDIVKSWPKWKQDIQIGKINIKNNSMTKVTKHE